MKIGFFIHFSNSNTRYNIQEQLVGFRGNIMSTDEKEKQTNNSEVSSKDTRQPELSVSEFLRKGKTRKTPKICSVEGCATLRYAKGLCRKHYNESWRMGHVGRAHDYVNSGYSKQQYETLSSKRRELARALEMYNHVYGLESRVKWRKEITELEKDIEKIEASSVIEKDKPFVQLGEERKDLSPNQLPGSAPDPG
jgi:hypothetical protein